LREEKKRRTEQCSRGGEDMRRELFRDAPAKQTHALRMEIVVENEQYVLGE
jgi:hypothetical protein